MSRPEMRGVLPAIVTPMDSDGVFLPEPMERLCDVFYRSGVHGVYVCGQTGEGLQQTAAQRSRVAACAVRFSPPGKIVMVHVGAASTAEAIVLAQQAERAGAHALSALPPGGAYSMDEVHDYYSSIAAATWLPLFIYFFPGFAPRPASVDDLRRLCAIPRVAGLKFTSTDLFTLWKLKQEGVVVFNGYDEILGAGLWMGADGGIGTFYNVVPEWVAEIYACSQEGRIDQARQLQDRFNRLIELALRYPVHAATKEILAWQGIDCGFCKAPRANLTVEQKRELRQELEKIDLPRR